MRAGGNQTGGDRPYGTDVDTCDSLVAHSLRAEGFDASEDGTGRGTPLVPVSVAIRGRDEGGAIEMGDDVAHALRSSQGGGDKPHVLAPVYGLSTQQEPKWAEDVSPTLAIPSKSGGGQTTAIAFDTTQITSKGNYSNPKEGDPCHPLAAGAHAPAVAYGIGSDAVDRSGESASGSAGDRAGLNIVEGVQPSLRARSNNSVAHGWAVRRLTPTECARLQGFPDHHCRIPWRGKPAEQCPDGPQYKAYGNSMSTNVMRWIGERIEAVDAIPLSAEERAA